MDRLTQPGLRVTRRHWCESFFVYASAKAAFLAPAIVLLAGCLDAGSARLVGTWQMETADEIQRRLNDDASQESPLADVIKSTNKLFRRVGGASALGHMSMDFHSGGTMDTVTDFPMARGQKSYRWKVKSYDRSNQRAVVLFELIDQSSSVKEITETKITFIDDETIQLVPPNLDAIQMELIFRRQLQ